MDIVVRRTGANDYGRFIKALICGPPGSGKTLTSSTWPNPIYASAEAGLMSIASLDLPYVKIEKINDLLGLKMLLDQSPTKRAKQFGFPVETLIVDTIDEIQRLLIRERLEDLQLDGPRMNDWNYFTSTMFSMVSGLRNLDMHVVFLSHLKEVSDTETGRTFYKPQLQGAFADQLPAMIDLSLLLKAHTSTQVVDNKVEAVTNRHLQTHEDAFHDWIKDRSGKLPPQLPINFDDDFERISRLIFGDISLKQADEIILEVEVPTTTAPAPANIQKRPPSIRGHGTQVAPQRAAAPATSPKAPSKLTPPPADVKCSDCSKPIEAVGSMSASDRVDLAELRFRRPLCAPCFTKAATQATVKEG